MKRNNSSNRAVRGVIAFIGIGANLGDPANQCLGAVQRLEETDGIHVLRCSSLYRTEPVGRIDQDWFINMVVEIRTEMRPRELMGALKSIEVRMGRIAGEKWGPRLIDLDILLYNQEVIDEDGLTIPHPEMHRRRFVLEPLCEIASYAIHPAFGVSARGLMERLADQSKVLPILG